jgi:parallel beta-helix repeat protein
MKSNTKNLAILLVLGLFFPIFLSINTNFSSKYNSNITNPRILGGYTEPYIHIDGSKPGNWSNMAIKYPWCDGSGTWKDPYVIENVTIDASNSPTGNGIFIENSKNEYFIIRNCTVYNSGSSLDVAGIKLENASRGTITYNNCSYNGRNGILLYSSCHNNTITFNNVNSNQAQLLDQDSAISLKSNCSSNFISRNIVKDNEQNGIFLKISCENNTIFNNTLINNNYGIDLWQNCYYNNITGNMVSRNTGGIWLRWDCHYNDLVRNIVIDNDFTGLRLSSNGENVIFNNSLNYNYMGL